MRIITPALKALILAGFGGVLFGQVITNAFLSGNYFVRHVQFTTDNNNNATDVRSINGTMTFDGNGNYVFTGQQVVGTGSIINYSSTGTYVMQPTGILTLTNPQDAAVTLNARFGTEAVIGSTTEIGTNTFDLFVAIPAPAPTVAYSDGNLSTSYVVVDWELPLASTSQVRNAMGSLQFDGRGNISAPQNIQGHGSAIAGGVTQQQSGYTGTYSLNGNGTGTITFQLPSGQSAANSLIAGGSRNLAVSSTGNIFLASTPNGHDILIGLQDAASSNITAANFTGRYWASSLEIDAGTQSSSNVSSLTVIAQDSAALTTERLHESSVPNLATYTAASYFSDSSGESGIAELSLGAAVLTLGNDSTFLAADVGTDIASGKASGLNTFNIAVGVRMPNVSGNGVFINPQGIINAGANAPVGNPISPGEFIAIYGSGLASQTVSTTYPYPPQLGGVQVSIGGLPAPIQLVSDTQINCLVPYEVNATGETVAITVRNNNTASNTVVAPIAATSPGIYSNDLTGVGEGAITHNTTGALVSATNPAVAGEVLVAYLTGLGALQAPVIDGQAPNPEGADSAAISPQVQVQVDGVPSPKVYYAGINPVYPGLYQIDFQMPQVPDHGQDVNVVVIAGQTATSEVLLYAQ